MKIDLKYNGNTTEAFACPGFMGIIKKNDIIKNIDIEVYEKELKTKINNKKEPLFILLEQEKELEELE